MKNKLVVGKWYESVNWFEGKHNISFLLATTRTMVFHIGYVLDFKEFYTFTDEKADFLENYKAPDIELPTGKLIKWLFKIAKEIQKFLYWIETKRLGVSK
jgi:hypothetical protein